MRNRADHLDRSLVTVLPLSLLSSWDATRCQWHTQTHTLGQDRRYRARFSYKFPMGEHQTPPVVWRSTPLFPCPLLFSPSLSQLLTLSSSGHPLLSFFPPFFLYSPPAVFIHQSAFVPQTVFSLPFHLPPFPHCHQSFMRDELSLCDLQVSTCQPVVFTVVSAAMRLHCSRLDCWAMKRVMTHTTSCIYTPKTHTQAPALTQTEAFHPISLIRS